MLDIFAADRMGLPLLVLTQLFSKNPRKNSRRTIAKTEFNVKWPFKVIRGHAFWSQWKGNEKPNKLSHVYNNVGLIS